MGQFRVMTFNVENLFAVGDPFGPDTRAELNAKVRSLAAVVDQAEPHVVGLQEVGSPAALTALQGALSRPMPHSVLGEPDSRGIRVAYLSTRVLREPTSIEMFPTAMLPVQSGDGRGSRGPSTKAGISRPGLHVTVRANGSDVGIVNCHLKSKLLSFPDNRIVFSPNNEDQRARFGAYALYRRASEAATLRSFITDAMGERGESEPFVLVGDMNDEVEAATTQILQGAPGSEYGTRGFNRTDNGDTSRLYNLAALLPDDQRFSRMYRGRAELIDHIFASRFLINPHRTPTMSQHLATPALPSIDDDANARRAEPGSDHAALMATFDW